ncbi:MAG: UvrD-helicase domain-containing protein [Chloroflexota bacterium]|nr:UvrD-helicase domain-containing protein [Chloroflexota bacterium]
MSDLLTGLNPQQKEAVTTLEGPVLVLAGPGSGKTRVLTHRIGYLIQQGIDPWQILAVTFTNKAAREMRERLDRLVGEQGRDVAMGTFHSLCARILRRHVHHLGYENSFLIYDTGDQRQLVKQAIVDLNLNDKTYRPYSVHAAISRAKNEGRTPRTFGAESYWEEVVARIYEVYQETLQRNNALDFDDLLLLTVRLFQEVPQVLEAYRRRWRYIHVDEFQDTNLMQYKLVRLLGEEHTNVFTVGDIDQSIYQWRGADYRNVLKFEETFPQAKTIALEQNYRSTQTILDAASELIRYNRDRKDKELWSDLGQGVPIIVFEAYDEGEEAQYIVREIRRLKAREGYDNRDFAVMYRTNAQSRALEEAFVRSSLKYVIVGGTRFYERREVKDILAYLRLLQNPYDAVSLERIINVPSRGIGTATYGQLVEWAERLAIPPFTALQVLAGQMDEEGGEISPLLPIVPPPFDTRSRNALLDFYRTLQPIRQDLETMNLPMVIGEVVERTGYEAYIRDDSVEGEDRWANVIEIQNVAAQYEHLTAKQALPEFLESAALISDADHVPEEAFDAVTLLTLHTAKGLEYPVVFIPGMDNNILPHSRAQESPEELEEERRLAYVGITRAKERLYLIHTFRRTMWGRSTPSEPSRFLRELPREALEISKERSKRPAGERRTRGPGVDRDTDTGGTAWTTRRVAPRQGQGSTERKQKSADTRFQAGDRVRHSKFGEGIVVNSKPSGGDEEVVVAFPGEGTKKLLASFARLEKL